MNDPSFELVGHDCPSDNYPAPVVAIGHFCGKTVAVYPGADSELDPQKDEVEGLDFVSHSPELRHKLRGFDYRSDRLFAYAPDDVVFYEAAEESDFFRDRLRDTRCQGADPFVRLTLARKTGDISLVLKEIAGCLVNLSEQSPSYARVWCQEELTRVFAEMASVNLPAQIEPRNQRILIADDQRDMTHLLRDHFEGLGFLVSVAHDGQTALRMVKELKPDLVLLDIMMPVLDGLAVLDAIKADPVCRDTRVIVMSARTGGPSRQIAIEKGAVQYIGKPADLAIIQHAAELALA